MAESLHIGADIFAALGRYSQAAIEAAQKASEAGRFELQTSLQESARRQDSWRDIADHIEVWEDEDGYVAGVRHPDHVDKAMVAEFGDAKTPPIPILRNMPDSVNRANSAMEKTYRDYLGIGDPNDY